MKKRLTDNEFHTKESKERACYIQEPRLQAIYDKLFELEDIEEELGIDLVTLIKLLKLQEKEPTIYYKDSYRCKKIKTKEYNFLVDIAKKCITEFVYLGSCSWDTIIVYKPLERHYCLYFKDYGKTWALTKEELKK